MKIVKKEENYIHNIAINSRGEGIIEPQIKEQWFIAVNKEFERDEKTTTLKKLMREAVDSKKIEIIPIGYGLVSLFYQLSHCILIFYIHH